MSLFGISLGLDLEGNYDVSMERNGSINSSIRESRPLAYSRANSALRTSQLFVKSTFADLFIFRSFLLASV